MTLAIEIPRRPSLRERDVDLATTLARLLELRAWRARLPTVRVVRASRYVRGLVICRHSWWDVRLEADDGWYAQGEIVDIEPLIDVAAIQSGLPPSECVVPPARIRRIVRWLLWEEIWLVQDRLSNRLMSVELTEVP